MGRKGKKSKKQLEDELAKVSVEQKQNEEQQRLQDIEQAIYSAAKKRLEEELDGRWKVEEAERLEEENVIVAQMKGDRKQSLEFENQKLADKKNWKKFISCNTRPNCAYENEITTYQTMLREEKVTAMETAVSKCLESEEIVGDLMELYCKAREEGDKARQEWCQHYIWEIRDSEIDLVDEATAYLLQYIEKQEANSHSQVLREWGKLNDTIKVGFWGHLQSKGFRGKPIEHQKIQIGLDLPKSISMQSMGHYIGVRSLYTTYDNVHGKDPSRMPVGGMIRVDLLSIPPFSKKVKGWTIRQIPPEGQEMQKLAYPNTEHATGTAMAVLPVRVDYKVPPHVIIRRNPDNPTVSLWDTTTEKWTSENITEVSWEPDTRKISFFTGRLAAFSITQERHLDLPYRWWCLHPVGPLQVELVVQAARYELHFIITEDGLQLKGPEKELPELRGVMYNLSEEEAAGVLPSSLGNEPRVRSPAALLCELRECGLNLLPEDGDAEFLDGYTVKMPETQARAYSDLSEIAAYYDIASSKHNKDLGPERSLVRIRENLLFEEYDPLDPDCDVDYQGVMFFPDKACFVQSLEGTSPCNEKMLSGHVTHASLYLCFQKAPQPVACPSGQTSDQLQRMEVNCANARFVESVRQTMAIMRLLSFT